MYLQTSDNEQKIIMILKTLRNLEMAINSMKYTVKTYLKICNSLKPSSLLSNSSCVIPELTLMPFIQTYHKKKSLQ